MVKVEIPSDPLDELARQFAEANSQEQQWLRMEIKELRALLWAAASSQPHGELVIGERDIAAYHPDDCEFESRDDKWNRTKIIRANLTRRGVDGKREPVPMFKEPPCTKSTN